MGRYPLCHGSQRPLCVIVPTRNEAANVTALVARIERALSSVAAELLFVDDSSDGTCDRIEQTARSAALPVRLIHRPPNERSSGLGGAVVAGLRATAADCVVIMDGDLQHPPELLLALVAATREFDIVVASRYNSDRASADGLSSRWRRVASLATTTAAKVAFPRRLARVTDPMSGYFVLRRAAIDLDALNPRGFKILLEIVVRNPGARVGEIAFTMEQRFAGTSKASCREALRYIAQLVSLRIDTAASACRAASRFEHRQNHNDLALSR